MPSTNCTNCPGCRARATIYRQLIEKGSIDIIAAAGTLAAWMASPTPGIVPERAGAALNNTAVARITVALGRIEKMPRRAILDDAKDLGICSLARQILGTRIGEKRVRAEDVLQEGKR